ncbi:MAG: hypothetical protein LAT55_12025 [Opitutales bacterium]|nr:hypothetical protein [Opitutales bacterium]
MNRHFEYQGYQGSVEPDTEKGGFFGKVLLIRDLITYQAETTEQLDQEFRISVDGYLADCASLHKQPDVP